MGLYPPWGMSSMASMDALAQDLGDRQSFTLDKSLKRVSGPFTLHPKKRGEHEVGLKKRSNLK